MPEDFIPIPTVLDEEYELRDLGRFIEEEIALNETLEDML